MDGKMNQIETYYNHNETIKIYRQYKAGLIDEKAWVSYLVDILKDFVQWLVDKDKNHMPAGCERTDLMQSGIFAVMKNAKNYNPEISRPSTFFSSIIRGAMRDCCVSSNTMTEHYAKLSRKLETSLKEAGFAKGTDDPTLTIETMSLASGLSVDAIENILSQKNKNENN